MNNKINKIMPSTITREGMKMKTEDGDKNETREGIKTKGT